MLASDAAWIRNLDVIEGGNKSCCAQSQAARIAGLRSAPLPARSSPACQHSADGGLPGRKIALYLQLPDLALQTVDHLAHLRRPAPCRRAQTVRLRASSAPVSSC
jgi:hypothetical protein